MEGAAGLPELVEGLISHMNRTRRLFLILMMTAFLIAPASLVLALVILSPGITLAGPEYSFMVEYDELPHGIYTEHGDGFYWEEGTYGEFEGRMEGRLLGERFGQSPGGHANVTAYAGEFVLEPPEAFGGRMPHANATAYTGEFVGEFDGMPAVFIGDFVGTFEGDSVGLYEDRDSYGLYDGLFEGIFVGFFEVGDDGPKIDVYDDYLVPAYTDPGYAVGFVGEDSFEHTGLAPRFMAIDYGAAPHTQTDITIPVVAMVVLVAAVSGVVLYVGLREISFYSGWSSRFDRYMERKREIDRELAGDADST